jgi:F0F1-type ATP synthase assembly protein I
LDPASNPAQCLFYFSEICKVLIAVLYVKKMVWAMLYFKSILLGYLAVLITTKHFRLAEWLK